MRAGNLKADAELFYLSKNLASLCDIIKKKDDQFSKLL